jgi:ribosomal protein S18 acetylase RimI-like enzyme
MSPIAPPDLSAAIEDNTLAYWRAVCSVVPAAELHDGPHGAWFHTELPFFPFNQVLRFDEGDADELLAAFRAHGLPFCWNVGPASRLPGLDARLQARSPDRTGGMPAMAVELSPDLGAHALPGGVIIERVRDEAGLARWAAAYRDAFDLPPGFVAGLRDAYAAIGFEGGVAFRHYVALLDGAPVASATAFLHEGLACLWHIGTLETARGRGIGAAMTVAPLLDAREQSCHTGILYASEMGAPLYRRLGFRELFRLEQYGWGESL